eukprot:SAG31_NODE_3720_length_3951_cov_2.268172_3_plen_219_part_00
MEPPAHRRCHTVPRKPGISLPKQKGLQRRRCRLHSSILTCKCTPRPPSPEFSACLDRFDQQLLRVFRTAGWRPRDDGRADCRYRGFGVTVLRWHGRSTARIQTGQHRVRPHQLVRAAALVACVPASNNLQQLAAVAIQSASASSPLRRRRHAGPKHLRCTADCNLGHQIPMISNSSGVPVLNSDPSKHCQLTLTAPTSLSLPAWRRRRCATFACCCCC